jgi:hypothetical protein
MKNNVQKDTYLKIFCCRNAETKSCAAMRARDKVVIDAFRASCSTGKPSLRALCYYQRRGDQRDKEAEVFVVIHFVEWSAEVVSKLFVSQNLR